MNSSASKPSSAHPTGERRRVAILFADLRDFTSLSEERDPEEIADFLHPLLHGLSAVIEEHGGYLDKYIGDAIMALFGAPVAHEDDLARAVRAGLALVEVAGRIQGPNGEPLALRVGIHHGEVVAGTHGAGGGVAYTVTGDAANTAARLQSAAPPGSVLISDRVHRAIASLVEARALPALTLKGKRERVRGWIVEGIRSTPARKPRQAPFVGREAQRSRLETAAERVRKGGGLAVVVEGEAGIGKSRLVEEFTARLASSGWRVLEGRADPLGGTPFAPLRQILRSALSETAGSDPEKARRICSTWVGPDEYELEREILSLVDLAEPDARSPAGGGRAEMRRLALERVFRALAAERPTAIVVEDLHWLDADTLELLVSLTARVREASVLLLMTTRPPFAEFERLPAESRPDLLALAPLDDGSCEELAQTLARQVGIEPGDLGRRSAGNPLFLEELVAAAGENGDELPDSIHALIQSRLDRIPEGPRTALRYAAVLGVEFPRSVLQNLCSRATGDPALEADLDFLLNRQFLIQPDESNLAFRHALVREVAYDNELKRERRRMHEWAGEAIESVMPAGPQLHPLLAHHYSEAEAWPRALPHLQAAGHAALEQYAVREGERWLEKAAQALERNAVSLPAESAPSFWEDLAECRLHRGAHRAALKAADQLIAVARASGSERFVSRAHLLRGQIHWSQDQPRPAREEFERGLSIVPQADREERAELLNACGIAASLGDQDGEIGERWLREALDLWRQGGDRLGEAKASVNIANLMVSRNRLEEALEWYDRTLALGRTIPDRMVVIINLTNRGMVQVWRGEYADAELCLGEGLKLAEELGLEQHALRITEDLGRCHLAVGDLRTAVDLFRRVQSRAQPGDSPQAGWADLYLGRAYFAALDTKRAVHYWETCRRLLEERPDRGLEAELLLDEGRLARLEGNRDLAVSRFQEALSRADETRNILLAIAARGFVWLVQAEGEGCPPSQDAPLIDNRPPLVALLRFQTGRALLACGRPGEALAQLGTAAALTDAMGADRLGRHVHIAAHAAALEVGEAEAATRHLARARALSLRLAERLPADVPTSRFRDRLSPKLRTPAESL